MTSTARLRSLRFTARHGGYDVTRGPQGPRIGRVYGVTSGRWRAEVLGAHGGRLVTEQTFRTRGDAALYLLDLHEGAATA